ncbi:MAG: cell division protein FtsZ [Candidatus Odinarchaeota archaeon]
MQSILREALDSFARENQPERPITPTSHAFSDILNETMRRQPNDDNEILSILHKSKPKIQVIGIGGAGNNAVHRLSQSIDPSVEVEIIAINTDAQDLLSTSAHKKLLIGTEVTRGFGAGNDPTVGESAAKESFEQLKHMIDGDLVFITCGLGGGTGTGAAHVAAGIAKEHGALAISVCTLPFRMEGPVRLENASKGLRKLYDSSDTVIVIPNEKLLKLNSNITIVTAFKIADEVLVRAVKAITELITKPQMINVDFADVRKVLADGGVALIGLGSTSSQNEKVKEAVNDALKNPLLDDIDLPSARKALICVMGGQDLELKDAEQVVARIASEIDPDAEIIWGASIQPDLGSNLRVIAILSDVQSTFTRQDISTLNQAETIRSLLDEFPSMFENRDSSMANYKAAKAELLPKKLLDRSKDRNSRKKRFGVF